MYNIILKTEPAAMQVNKSRNNGLLFTLKVGEYESIKNRDIRTMSAMGIT